MHMLIGKKQILLTSLVFALGIAVYLNWLFVSNEEENLVLTNGDASQTENYGDAQLVEGQSENAEEGEAYFAEAKLSRTKSRDQAVEALKTMLADANLTTEEQLALTQQATELAETIELEGKMENLIKAKGIADCMVYYDGETADVIVGGAELEDTQVAQILDIVVGETELEAQNISVIEAK